MKPVPDYAQNMSAAVAKEAIKRKAVQMAPHVEYEAEINDNNVDQATHQYLILWQLNDIVNAQPDNYMMRPFDSPHTNPAQWLAGDYYKYYELTSPQIMYYAHDHWIKKAREQGKIRAYEQYYSVLARLMDWKDEAWNDKGQRVYYVTKGDPAEYDIYGWQTAHADWPKSGTVLYRGIAMDHTDRKGKLSYTVDFATETGKGEITELLPGKSINLEASSNNGGHLTGAVKVDGKDAYPDPKGGADLTGVTYDVHFYGPRAEEIAGYLIGASKRVAGFAGQQQ